MIDGIKIWIRDNLNEIRNNSLMDFIIPASISTGAIKTDKKPIAEYQGLIFIDKNSHIEIRGSLHKFYNNGRHNYNDFGVQELIIAINKLTQLLNIRPEKIQIVNLEIGINLKINYNPGDFLNSLIIHRGKRFTYQSGRNKEFMECAHSQFYIKIYNKGLQYSLPYYLLRIEAKFIKMEKLNNLGISHLSDLQNINKLQKLKDQLLRIYDEILIGDINLKPKVLNKKDITLFINGHNANYWSNLSPNAQDYKDRVTSSEYKKKQKKYERTLARFKHLLNETGAISRKLKVKKLMDEKSSRLLHSDLRIIDDPELSKKRGKLTDKIAISYKNIYAKSDQKTGEIDRQKSSMNQKIRFNFHNAKTGEIDPLLYSVNSTNNTHNKQRICKVTGLNISMQKENSEFLCTTGIQYYKNHCPEIWLKLWKRLTSRWYGSSEEIQVQEIHHSIRNEFFNKIHNTRRSIKKVLEEPALFDQLSLINPYKLEVAGLTN